MTVAEVAVAGAAMQGVCLFSRRRLSKSTQSHRQYWSRRQHQSCKETWTWC